MNASNLASRWAPRWLVSAVLLAWLAGATAGVTQVYEWREPNGAPVFSMTPPPASVGSYTVRSVTTPTVDAAQQAQAAQKLAHERELATTGRDATRPNAADTPGPQDRLAEALRARELGREPLPGERLHDASGGSRLTPAYFERQERLADAVRAASGPAAPQP